MRLFRVDALAPSPEAVQAAVVALNGGHLVILPTETVYGIGAVAANPAAMQRLYEAKHREPQKQVAWLIGGIENLPDGTAPLAHQLAAAFWPGPLTIVLPMPDGTSQGFRVPAHPVALAVIREMGPIPLAVSSANRSGEPPALTAQDAMNALTGKVAVTLDSGPAQTGIPSTVIRVDTNEIHILRRGAITRENLLPFSAVVHPKP